MIPEGFEGNSHKLPFAIRNHSIGIRQLIT